MKDGDQPREKLTAVPGAQRDSLFCLSETSWAEHHHARWDTDRAGLRVGKWKSAGTVLPKPLGMEVTPPHTHTLTMLPV